mgnify:CR=1 FL=1
MRAAQILWVVVCLLGMFLGWHVVHGDYMYPGEFVWEQTRNFAKLVCGWLMVIMEMTLPSLSSWAEYQLCSGGAKFAAVTVFVDFDSDGQPDERCEGYVMHSGCKSVAVSLGLDGIFDLKITSPGGRVVLVSDGSPQAWVVKLARPGEEPRRLRGFRAVCAALWEMPLPPLSYGYHPSSIYALCQSELDAGERGAQ